MFCKSSLTSRLSLMLLGTSFLIGCASESVGINCLPPAWPDERVWEELDNVPITGYEDFWEWMARVEKLNGELEVCQR